jgi:nitrogen-specific signal transduction histidine kinase/ActR/RegA family two-component response regulator
VSERTTEGRDPRWPAELAAAEGRFRTIIERTADAIVVVDGDGVVLFANPAAGELFDLPAGELEGEHFGFPLAAGDDTEVDIHPGNGSEPKVAEMRVAATEWEGREVLLASLRDITDRRRLEELRAEQALERARRSEAEVAIHRLQLLADAGALLASSLTPGGPLQRFVRLLVPRFADWCLVVLANDAAKGEPETVFGAHASADDEVLLDELVPLYRQERVKEVFAPHAELVREGEAWTAELPGDAGERFSRVGLSSAIHLPLEMADRVLGCMTVARCGRPLPPSALTGERYVDADLAFARELGRRICLALENARLYRDAEEASRMRDEFMAKVSHELRTPLQAILGWTSMLRADPGDGERLARGIEVIERNAHTQVHLIEDILDVSRIITGKLSLQRQPVAVRPAVEAALESLTPKAEQKGVRLAGPEAGAPLLVFADPDRLQQVISNLVSNAVKYTPEGGTVRVALEQRRDKALISVIDDGDGIDPKVLPHIFHPFRQGAGKGDGSGLGLGLAIVRQLVEMHGGDVDAHSDGNGRGATFQVRLPLLTEDGRMAGVVPPVASEMTDGAPLADLRGLRLAVVDDEPDAREMLQTALGDLGADVWIAGSAEEFFRRLDERLDGGGAPPDVLISDIGMTGGDGYDLLAELRRRPEERGGAVPAVALTGFARPEDEGRALDAGFQRHVPKPVPMVRLAAAVSELARGDGGG